MKLISVPINESAMSRLDFDSCVDGDLVEFELSNDDFNDLWNSGVFADLNNELNIFIDDYEDQKININLLGKARKIVQEKLELYPSMRALESLLSQIDLAIKNKTGVFFFF